jgi:hypothetical protein
MKNGLWIIALVLVMAAGCAAYGPSPGPGYPPDAGGSYSGGQQGYGQEYGADMDMDYMYNYLAPHGNWVNMEPYGYVWTPRHMGYRWRPYSQGHWVMTDYGWTWIANEPWGSIPFHYGRWGYDEGPRHGLGSGLGELEMERPVRGLGAAAARSRIPGRHGFRLAVIPDSQPFLDLPPGPAFSGP